MGVRMSRMRTLPPAAREAERAGETLELVFHVAPLEVRRAHHAPGAEVAPFRPRPQAKPAMSAMRDLAAGAGLDGHLPGVIDLDLPLASWSVKWRRRFQASRTRSDFSTTCMEPMLVMFSSPPSKGVSFYAEPRWDDVSSTG